MIELTHLHERLAWTEVITSIVCSLCSHGPGICIHSDCNHSDHTKRMHMLGAHVFVVSCGGSFVMTYTSHIVFRKFQEKRKRKIFSVLVCFVF